MNSFGFTASNCLAFDIRCNSSISMCLSDYSGTSSCHTGVLFQFSQVTDAMALFDIFDIGVCKNPIECALNLVLKFLQNGSKGMKTGLLVIVCHRLSPLSPSKIAPNSSKITQFGMAIWCQICVARYAEPILIKALLQGCHAVMLGSGVQAQLRILPPL